MGKPTGFMEYPRQTPTRRPVSVRLNDWHEAYEPFSVESLQTQGARCMDCGIPFCHQGCPLGNVIPDWNHRVYLGDWQEALDRLHATNNFPEFTGRLCPAPCESSCVLGIHRPAVTIKNIEHNIIEAAWAEDRVRPQPPRVSTGKRVAVVGSGPAGLACAQQLRRVGHEVTVFERADRIGGLLVYGIPEFKMEKRILFRRLRQMEAEGVEFRPSTNIGYDVDAAELRESFDAVVLAGGATQARDLPIPGRELGGIHQAMEFLPQNNRRCLGDTIPESEFISAKDRRVVIIGGGDTGADCLGTVHRHGCRSVHQFEIMPRPPEQRSPDNPWPQWDLVYRVSTAHEEGGERIYQISTKEFLGDSSGRVRALRTVHVEVQSENGRLQFVDVPDTEQVYECELVLLALGFVGPEKGGMLDQLGVELDARGNVQSDANRMTSVEGVFTAGDMTRGQSLVVWAITEGRHAAAGVDEWLMGETDLPRPLDFGNDQRPFLC